MHDREAKTSERVEFTETRNLPTNDPEKGMRWMSYTAMNADQLKERAGVDRRGRKSTAGAVYSFSLAWHPEQKPEQEEMTKAADSLMAKLGLSDHQAVYIAHNDADHQHIHGVVNLVNPENGKTAQVKMDHLTMSKWAEEYERKGGKVYCDARVQNNAERERLKQEKEQAEGLKQEFNKASDDKKKKQARSAFVKHREQEAAKAPTISELYEGSDSGKAFKAALQEQGYTLAKGDRRGYVLVDQDGKVSSLSRQLKGQRAAAIKSRLQDIEKIETAKEIQAQRDALQNKQNSQNQERPQARKEADMNQQPQQTTVPTYDREAEEVAQQKALADAAMEHAKNQGRKRRSQSGDEKPIKRDRKDRNIERPTAKKIDKSKADDRAGQKWAADRLARQDREMEFRARTGEIEDAEAKKLAKFYDRAGMKRSIQELEEKLSKPTRLIDMVKGQRKKDQAELDNLRKQVADAEQRTQERMDALRAKHEAEREAEFPEPAQEALKRKVEPQRKPSIEQDQSKVNMPKKKHDPERDARIEAAKSRAAQQPTPRPRPKRGYGR